MYLLISKCLNCIVLDVYIILLYIVILRIYLRKLCSFRFIPNSTNYVTTYFELQNLLYFLIYALKNDFRKCQFKTLMFLCFIYITLENMLKSLSYIIKPTLRTLPNSHVACVSLYMNHLRFPLKLHST